MGAHRRSTVIIMEDDKIVVLDHYHNQYEAEIVKGILETTGLIAGVTGDYFATNLNYALETPPFAVMVFERDLDLARQILEAQPIEPAQE